MLSMWRALLSSDSACSMSRLTAVEEQERLPHNEHQSRVKYSDTVGCPDWRLSCTYPLISHAIASQGEDQAL